jgi:GTPase SAR1 family protein
VLTEGPTPTTDLINILKYGDEHTSRVVENLRVTRYPLEFLRVVNIVDTPGTNSIVREHDDLTRNVIPKSDFIVFVISVDRPLSDSEREFLELISIKWKRKVIFLLNKIDTKDDSEVQEVLAYLRQEVSKILGLEPRLFPISVKQAFQGKTRPDDDLLRRSQFGDVERYIWEALTAAERIRLKLVNPLHAVQPICQTAETELHAKLALLDEDMQRLRHVEKQLTYMQDDLRENYARFILRIKNVLLDLRNRANDFVDDFLQIRNIFDLASKDKTEHLFHEKVVKDANQQIEDILTEAADWMVKKSMRVWDETLEYYKQQIQRDGHREKIIGAVGGQFAYDRNTIYQTVIRESRERIKAFDFQAESRRILKAFQNAMIHFAAAEVGAIGVGAALILIFEALLLDITGILASGVLVTAGFFILPRKRRQAKNAFDARIQALIQELDASISQQFDSYMLEKFAELKDTLSPFDRFCRAEHDELEAARTELQAVTQRLSMLQQDIITNTPK